jgi:hypothetical protein
MLRNRTGRAGTWAIIVLLLLVAAGVGVLYSLTRMTPSAPPSQAPTQPSAGNAQAAESWKAFVDDARAKCEQEPGCTVDYSALHDYEGKYFGVMIIGYKDSEYITDLYHYDRESKEWVTAPKYVPEGEGYELIDTETASKDWGVPKETLDEWIASAEKAVQKVYERRAQEQQADE